MLSPLAPLKAQLLPLLKPFGHSTPKMANSGPLHKTRTRVQLPHGCANLCPTSVSSVFKELGMDAWGKSGMGGWWLRLVARAHPCPAVPPVAAVTQMSSADGPKMGKIVAQK